ncbi:SulP family inorganic anion transporter [Photobacterium galatheae]|uniref:Sulfate transporter n=1 Tax=Photobacterium galatheae TaxID=1654360 RepID=A0A066RMT8_9GAMM|nr:SulP family inorganic anion transporter [Photobacterium galatheae]KDM90451.1 sulfate transporter [Photobacterium galatheae]MCM0147829.1 STAS domain-containing protein [Photobacterium galatheae]
MIAVKEAYQAGLFQRQHWVRNIISGVIVGIVALPLAMAFAIASGAKPEQGLYTAIVAGFFVSALGGSRVQIAGPTGAFIVVLSGITAQYGISGLQVATLMAGVMLLFLGLTKLGTIIRFIPAPVITGFTAGIGVVIWVGQWQYFFGLPDISGQHFHNKLYQLLQILPDFHGMTTLLAVTALLLTLFSPKLPGMRRIPGPLVALLIVTLLQSIFQFSGVATIGSQFGGIPQGLPEFALPSTRLEQVIELIGPAFTIAMLGAIESLLSAVVADGMTNTRHDANQELVGQGIANIAAPLFGGFAATGAIARTATNIRNGGTSPLAGIVHSLTLVLILLALAPLASYIPLAALAAILFVVAWNMSEAHHFVQMIRRAPTADVVILLITFLLTVFADLVVAVNIGVLLATFHFLRRMASSVEVKEATHQELHHEITQQGMMELPPGVLVFTVDGPFFFGAVDQFERILANTHTDPDTVIIRLKWVPFIDMTGLKTLASVIGNLQKRGITVLISNANARVSAKLRKAGVIELIGEQCYCATLQDALSAAISHDSSTQPNLPAQQMATKHRREDKATDA